MSQEVIVRKKGKDLVKIYVLHTCMRCEAELDVWILEDRNIFRCPLCNTMNLYNEKVFANDTKTGVSPWERVLNDKKSIVNSK